MLRVRNEIQNTSKKKTFIFKITENTGAGDCLFLSLLDFFNENEDKFQDIPSTTDEFRSRLMEKMLETDIMSGKKNFDRLIHMIIHNSINELPILSQYGVNDEKDNEIMKEYCEYMSKSGNLGTFTELCVAAELFNFVGYVIQSTGSNIECYEFGFSGNNKLDSQKPKLFLYFTGLTKSGHFRYLKPVIPRNPTNILTGSYEDVTIKDPSLKYKSTTIIMNVIANNEKEEKFVLSRIVSQNQFECDICKEIFESQKGMRIHRNIHKKKPKITKEDIEKWQSDLNDFLYLSSTTETTEIDPNDVICPLCTNEKKICKGSRGLKIHYSKAHKEFLSDLSNGPDKCIVDIDELSKKLNLYRKSIRVLKRIPKGARIIAAKKLESVITKCTNLNNLESWCDLLLFSYIALQIPKRSSKKNKLTSIVKNNINTFDESSIKIYKQKTAPLSKRIEAKIADGDIKGAVRILSSTDEFATVSPSVLEELKKKHPAPSRPLSFPEAPKDSDSYLICSKEDVLDSIRSFYNGSAGGIDGLRPQVLKDLLSNETGDSGSTLLSSIKDFSNMMLAGKVLKDIIPIIYGASLCALEKKDGGIRPIAVGTTFRRLTAKIACKSIRAPIGEYLRPKQFGFATKSGCEVVLHGTRTFLKLNSKTRKILLKIDFKNAFNSIERDEMLKSVKEKTPALFPFLWQCYSSDSFLFYGDKVIMSQVGAQQGDPLGPMAFSLTIHPIIETLASELNLWYLDDGTLGGDPETILNDFQNIIEKCKAFGLEVNPSKCEIYFISSFDQSVYDKFAEISPGIKNVNDDLSLLGAPLTDHMSEVILNKKFKELTTLFDRLQFLNSHIAYFLLKNCLCIPKLTYLLRTCPTWRFPSIISKFDNSIREATQKMINTSLSDDKWKLSSLPSNHGGIGIRRLVDIGVPAFLASVYGVFNLVCDILHYNKIDLLDISFYEDAINAWNIMCPDNIIPSNPSNQHDWDNINIQRIVESLPLSSKADMARYKSSIQKESNAWLSVLPSKAIGTLLDNNSFRISVALRLGCDICIPHTCHCGAHVDRTGTHGLSCIKSAGRFFGHSSINDVIKRAFSSAKIPAIIEKVGLCRNDGKRVDGMTLVPWQNGQTLVWDATCADTLAPSYLKFSSKTPGRVAENAATKKRNLYKELIENNYFFLPFAVETLGPWCCEAKSFIKCIGKMISNITGETRSTTYLIQRISIEIQRRNSACVMGSLPLSNSLDEIFFLL